MKQYDFFPNEICDGEYNTQVYNEVSDLSAKRCILFQLKQGYKHIIIPSVVYNETPQNYLYDIRRLYIEPFVKAIKDLKVYNKERLLTVVIKESQLLDLDYINELLNLVTSYEEITGVYLVPYYDESVTKRIKNIETINNLMKFIHVLKENEMYVHLAYSDIEGLIYSVGGIDSISIGTFENLRRFNLRNFDITKDDKTDKKHSNNPNKRIYSNKLLQWIDLNYLGGLKEVDNFDELFEQNKYITSEVPEEQNWRFKLPELYKHYMMSIYNQYKRLPRSYNQRLDYIKEKLLCAKVQFERIEEFGILFDTNNDGSHIPCWFTAINLFDKYKK